MIIYRHHDGRHAEVAESRHDEPSCHPHFANLFAPGGQFRVRVLYDRTQEGMHGRLTAMGFQLQERRRQYTDTQRLEWLIDRPTWLASLAGTMTLERARDVIDKEMNRAHLA